MRYGLSFLLVLLTSNIAFAQRHYSNEELQRLADLGRLWGMVHYFHPSMNTGSIKTDSLIIHNAASLAVDPSAQNFKERISNMLGQLNDPNTHLNNNDTKESYHLFSPKPNEARVQKFPSGYWYISLPTLSATNKATPNIPSILPAAWDSSKGVVLDLRNAVVQHQNDWEFFSEFFPVIYNKIMGSTSLVALDERIPYHNGFVNQSDGTQNIYFSGWRTATNGLPSPPTVAQEMLGVSPFNKPLIIIVNKTNSNDLLKALSSFQASGKCLVVYEGSKESIPLGRSIEVKLTDGLSASLRISDFLLNNKRPQPVRFVTKIIDTSYTSPFIKQCFDDLDNWTTLLQKEDASSTLSSNFEIPKLGTYPLDTVPSLGLRLFALYNYWNAIHYFFPYKNLLPESWDKQLLAHLPDFLNASDALKYNLALRSLTSDIHDSHGFLYHPKPPTAVREAFGYWPPIQIDFINDKLYVVGITKDSLQAAPPVELWDQIISINGIPVLKAMESWRRFSSVSNDAGFRRNLTWALLAGPKDSRFTAVINRNGKSQTVTMVRSGSSSYFARTLVDFNDNHPDIKKMEGNIGYVNMGKLQRQNIDSMFRTLIDTKAIIFDIRNYPRGTAWNIAPRLARKDSVAVRFEAPLVTYEHIEGGESAQNVLSYFTVRPDTTRPRFKGKVIMLCNQQTQSQAEYTIMMFQGATAVTVVGSQTAGADGNVTDVILPGGYTASFSGTAILYPNGEQTQRKGIRIDIPVKPTLAGLKAGKDEVLERALQYIETRK